MQAFSAIVLTSWIFQTNNNYRDSSLRAQRSNPEVIETGRFSGLLRHFVPRNDDAREVVGLRDNHPYLPFPLPFALFGFLCDYLFYVTHLSQCLCHTFCDY